MNKLKSFFNKRRIFMVLLFIAISLPVGISLSKYVSGFINDYIMEANDFYFSSDKLTTSIKEYNINNWNGNSSFVVQFQLNNNKNNALTSTSNVTYQVNVTCDDNVTCTLSNSSGTITPSQLKHDLTLTITPDRVFDTGESFSVRIEATSTSPYVKTIGAVFNANVSKQGLSYEINDEENSAYLDFIITNTLDQYTIFTAFDSYSVNDLISVDTYKSLSSSNKNNCASAYVTLSFDPNDILMDTTNNILNNTGSTMTTIDIDGASYVNSIRFKIDAMSSNTIRFYKIDKSLNHTYPFGDDESPVVTFSAEY